MGNTSGKHLVPFIDLLKSPYKFQSSKQEMFIILCLMESEMLPILGFWEQHNGRIYLNLIINYQICLITERVGMTVKLSSSSIWLSFVLCIYTYICNVVICIMHAEPQTVLLVSSADIIELDA